MKKTKLTDFYRKNQAGGSVRRTIPSSQELGVTAAPISTRVHVPPFYGEVEPFPAYIPQTTVEPTPRSLRRSVPQPPEPLGFEDLTPLNPISPSGLPLNDTLSLPGIPKYEYQQGPFLGYDRVPGSEYRKNPDHTYGQYNYKYSPGKLVPKKNQQGGEVSPSVFVERGEYVKDVNGEVYRVSDKMPTHDDKALVSGDKVKKVAPGKGGLELNNITQVVSATTENRKRSAKSHGIEDDLVRFNKEEANAFAMDNFNIKTNLRKDSSPAAVIDAIQEQKDKILKRYRKVDYREDNPYSSASFRANRAVLQSLPELSEVFDTVFQEQEAKKGVTSPQEEAYFQNGGSYTIRRGDTLSSLAKRYNTTVSELARLNNISNINLIREGSSISLPGTAPASVPASAPAAEPTSEGEVTRRSLPDSPMLTPRSMSSSSQTATTSNRFRDRLNLNTISNRSIPAESTSVAVPLNPLQPDAVYGSLWKLTQEDLDGLDSFSRGVVNRELVNKGYLKSATDFNSPQFKEAWSQYQKRNNFVTDFNNSIPTDSEARNLSRALTPVPLHAYQMLAKDGPKGFEYLSNQLRNYGGANNPLANAFSLMSRFSKGPFWGQDQAAMNSNSLTPLQLSTLDGVIESARERNNSDYGGTEYADYNDEGIIEQTHKGQFLNIGRHLFDPKAAVSLTLGRGVYYIDPETGERYYTDNYNWNKGDPNFSFNPDDGFFSQRYKELRNFMRSTDSDQQDMNSNRIRIKMPARTADKLKLK